MKETEKRQKRGARQARKERKKQKKKRRNHGSRRERKVNQKKEMRNYVIELCNIRRRYLLVRNILKELMRRIFHRKNLASCS